MVVIKEVKTKKELRGDRMADFSIITVTYNCEKTLKRAMDSVVNQTMAPHEYIIVDGKSSDNTLKIAESYKDVCNKRGIELKIISEKDNGIYDAMNKAVTHASGDYIIFLGAGDYLMDNIFDAIEKALQSDNPDILYGYVMKKLHELLVNRFLVPYDA